MVSLTAKWAADGKSVELASSSNLLAGDYTVTASGLDFTQDSATVKVEAPKATALEVKSTVLNDETAKAKVNLSLTDQYGEELALVDSQFTKTAFNKTQGKSVTLAFDGTDKYYYVNTTAPNADEFKQGDVISVTFIHNATGLKVTQDLTVEAGALVDTIAFGDVELPKDKDLLTTDLKDVKVAYTAKDQFGNDIALTKGGNVEVISSDSTILDASKVTLVTEDKVTKAKIASFEGKEGKVTLTILSNATGNTATIELDVQQAPGQVANVTVLDSEVTVAANSDAYVGLEVTDKYGKVIEAKDYKATIGLTSSNTAVAENGDLDIITTGDNTGKVEVSVKNTAPKGASTTITLTNTATGEQLATFVVKAGEVAVPTTVEVKESSKHKATLAKGAKTTINFEAKDQYGNKLGSNDAGYSVVFSVKDASENITLTNAVQGKVTVADETDASVEVNAAKTGSAVLVTQLLKGTEVIDSKETTFTVVANDSTVGLQIADIPTLFAQASGTEDAYYEEVKVETADGVALPASSIISVTSSNPSVVSVESGNKLKGVAVAEAGKDSKATITVIYNADDQPVTLTKEVTVSAADQKVAAILAVDTEQNSGTDILTELVDNTKAVTTINVEDFATLATNEEVFTIIQDNFGRFVNAKTGGTDYNDVTLTIGNATGFVDADGDDQLDLDASGYIDFGTLADNLIEDEAGKASFRILITAGGQVKAINVNVAGGETVAEAAVAAEAAKYEETATVAKTVEIDEDITATVAKLKSQQTADDSIDVSYSVAADAKYLKVVDGKVLLKAQPANGASDNTENVTITFSKGGKTDTATVAVTVTAQDAPIGG